MQIFRNSQWKPRPAPFFRSIWGGANASPLASGKAKLALASFLCIVASVRADAQDAINLEALKGLAPQIALPNSIEGRSALAANLTVSGAIQTGDLRQPTPLPFAAEQQQSLKDAFITDRNLAQLADGLGSTLGSAYVARAHYTDYTHFTSVSSAVADLIAYTDATTGSDGLAGKYFFANGTTDGKKPVSEAAAALLKDNSGTPDVFGRTYGHPAGAAGNDIYGNSRPFQTEPTVSSIIGTDYFNIPSNNYVYNRGPIMNLINSPSFPSAHSLYGYMGGILLGILVPERYEEMIARSAEYGNNRIIMGAHYAMDIIGGRALALYDLAHLLANDPAYLNRSTIEIPSYMGPVPKEPVPLIKDYQSAVKSARESLRNALEAGCGDGIDVCARQDIGRFNDPELNAASYGATQTYGLPVVYPKTADTVEDVGELAPEAGYLLTAAFPSLTLKQANQILTETQGPGGGFLDNGSSFGVYSRINLYAAVHKARKVAAKN